jgi:hypothetical protein
MIRPSASRDGPVWRSKKNKLPRYAAEISDKADIVLDMFDNIHGDDNIERLCGNFIEASDNDVPATEAGIEVLAHCFGRSLSQNIQPHAKTTAGIQHFLSIDELSGESIPGKLAGPAASFN